MSIAKNHGIFSFDSSTTTEIYEDVHITDLVDQDDPSNSSVNNPMDVNDVSTMENPKRML